MSALHQYICRQRDAACTLNSVIEAIAILDNEGLGANAVTALIGVAKRQADALYISLDSVNLPKADPTEAQPETPIMALYRRWQAISRAACAHPSHDDAELDRLFYDERDQVEDELMAIAPTSAQDMAAKALVAHCHGDFTCLAYGRDPFWIEARALVGLSE